LCVFLKGTAVVQQRRNEDEDPIEVAKLQSSDYFGKIPAAIPAANSDIAVTGRPAMIHTGNCDFPAMLIDLISFST